MFSGMTNGHLRYGLRHSYSTDQLCVPRAVLYIYISPLEKNPSPCCVFYIYIQYLVHTVCCCFTVENGDGLVLKLLYVQDPKDTTLPQNLSEWLAEPMWKGVCTIHTCDCNRCTHTQI